MERLFRFGNEIQIIFGGETNKDAAARILFFNFIFTEMQCADCVGREHMNFRKEAFQTPVASKV